MVTALTAAKAYADVQKAAGLDAGLGASANSGGGFGDILKAAMSDAIKSSKTAETQITAQVQGKADLVEVATAISAAQQNLTTMMSIRDQMISAYQEIMRMQI